MNEDTKAIVKKLPGIIDLAQANLRELAQKVTSLPCGMNGEFSEYLAHISSELECFADNVELLASDEQQILDDLEEYKLDELD